MTKNFKSGAWLSFDLVYPRFNNGYKRFNIDNRPCYDYNFGYGIRLTTQIWWEYTDTSFKFNLIILGFGFEIDYRSAGDIPL